MLPVARRGCHLSWVTSNWRGKWTAALIVVGAVAVSAMTGTYPEHKRHDRCDRDHEELTENRDEHHPTICRSLLLFAEEDRRAHDGHLDPVQIDRMGLDRSRQWPADGLQRALLTRRSSTTRAALG